MPRTTAPTKGKPVVHRRYLTVAMLILLALGLGLWIVSRVASEVTRRTATARLAQAAPGAALWWLDWSETFAAGDWHRDLLRASCLRRLRLAEAWHEALQSARDKQAPEGPLDLELRLARIQAGEIEGVEAEIGSLVDRGADPQDVAAAFISGYLAQNRAQHAKVFLEGWTRLFPGSAHVKYLEALFAYSQGIPEQAERGFLDALAQEPRHELARAGLAELLRGQERLEEARVQYAELARRSAAAEPWCLGLSAVLRQLGRTAEARVLLASRASQSAISPPLRFEIGEIALELGDYPTAQADFQPLEPAISPNLDLLRSQAIALAYQKNADCRPLWDREWKEVFRFYRVKDLRLRLATDPAAASELQRVVDAPDPLAADRRAPGPATQSSPAPSSPAAELYALHCNACHGPMGDGLGISAPHLFPRARDLRRGKSRLVSTRNAVPSIQDIETVLIRGMPGSSMTAFDQLESSQRRLLAEEVLRLRREGAREEILAALRAQDEVIEEEEVRRAVAVCTTPAETVPIPPFPEADQPSLARGEQSYLALGCNKCHGNDGRGAADQVLFDDQGAPARARDLVGEPFKGGREPQSVYLRIALGMPGTPHPAAANLTEDQLIELVHYVLSLARKPERVLTNFERATLSQGAEYLAAFPSTKP